MLNLSFLFRLRSNILFVISQSFTMIRAFVRKKPKEKSKNGTEGKNSIESENSHGSRNKCFQEVQKMIDLKNRTFSDKDESKVFLVFQNTLHIQINT